MNILRDDELLKIRFDEEKKLLWTEWQPTSAKANLSKEEIKQINKQIADYIEEYDADYYLADQRERGVVYTVDIQEYIAKVLEDAVVKAGVKRTAIVMPSDYIVKLSNEQTINEIKADADFDYFNEFDEAWKYLFG
jgi:homoserine trans-succinylase